MEFLPSISGLYAAYSNIRNISQNIINATSYGFKAKKILFNELHTPSSDFSQQVGAGVQISKKIQDFSDGKIIRTNNPMDVSITNNGFFGLQDDFNNLFLTRNGHFTIDNKYNIVSSNKMYLMGCGTKDVPNIINKEHGIRRINIKKSLKLDSTPTKNIVISSRLNNENLIKNDPFNPLDDQTYNKKFSTIIYDSLGHSKKINLFFLKKSSKIWRVFVTDDIFNKIQSFYLTFNDEGHLISKSEQIINLKKENDFNNTHIIMKLNHIVQVNNNKNGKDVIYQNGYKSGDITKININKNGLVLGHYTNKKIKKLGQIILFDVLSKESLSSIDDVTWILPNNKQIRYVGTPGDLHFKKLIVNALESSNVKINKELIDIIVAQRNYQSNVQFIKTQDKILNTLINLK